jgi:hypothetical protein
MALYKYTSNKDPQDGTEEIGVPGGPLVPLGGEIELTDEEYDQFKGRFNLRKSGDSDEAEESSDAEAKSESDSDAKAESYSGSGQKLARG